MSAGVSVDSRAGARRVRRRLGPVVTLTSLLGAAACAPAPGPTERTVAYYRTHDAERDATLAACANDPGGTAGDPACRNAIEAARVEDIGSLRDLPPLGLPTPTGEASQGASEAKPVDPAAGAAAR